MQSYVKQDVKVELLVFLNVVKKTRSQEIFRLTKTLIMKRSSNLWFRYLTSVNIILRIKRPGPTDCPGFTKVDLYYKRPTVLHPGPI